MADSGVSRASCVVIGLRGSLIHLGCGAVLAGPGVVTRILSNVGGVTVCIRRVPVPVGCPPVGLRVMGRGLLGSPSRVGRVSLGGRLAGLEALAALGQLGSPLPRFICSALPLVATPRTYTLGSGAHACSRNRSLGYATDSPHRSSRYANRALLCLSPARLRPCSARDRLCGMPPRPRRPQGRLQGRPQGRTASGRPSGGAGGGTGNGSAGGRRSGFRPGQQLSPELEAAIEAETARLAAIEDPVEAVAAVTEVFIA